MQWPGVVSFMSCPLLMDMIFRMRLRASCGRCWPHEFCRMLWSLRVQENQWPGVVSFMSCPLLMDMIFRMRLRASCGRCWPHEFCRMLWSLRVQENQYVGYAFSSRLVGWKTRLLWKQHQGPMTWENNRKRDPNLSPKGLVEFCNCLGVSGNSRRHLQPRAHPPPTTRSRSPHLFKPPLSDHPIPQVFVSYSNALPDLGRFSAPTLFLGSPTFMESRKLLCLFP
jgi:hypothetical protein